jgi:hypothetical protein
MARKLRLEFPGAIYHGINRGNYRRWIFADANTKLAFERCLFEAGGPLGQLCDCSHLNPTRVLFPIGSPFIPCTLGP